jgi:hypothetical protein
VTSSSSIGTQCANHSLKNALALLMGGEAMEGISGGLASGFCLCR